MTHTGQCFCGQVHFSIDAEPKGARVCWCRSCQRIASGSPTVNVLFPEEAVTWSGEITTIIKQADSGNTVERGFCPQCGSQLFSRTVDPQGAPIRIRAGVLDDPDLCPPSSAIWVSSAPRWAVFDPNLPKFSKGPDSPQVE
ncbi:GFA family protein [Novosphingobium flavum]|uniref:GFA family protein n=1 Tax=Novosphingobium flavum TaxID=1778672 RepID=A0A7X1FPX9_9SPHN|nr:GFA family protein [Novosphingobium flavum]MBC2664718.1 GFA family protein [Novosphingobium flavum]